jgi:glucose/arabinose dehydrogenase
MSRNRLRWLPLVLFLLGSSSSPEPEAELVASGLEVPWAMAAAPDGRLFLTERPGRIRVIENGRLVAKPWFVLEVARDGDAGLHGIALAPDFGTARQVYVMGTFRDGNGGLEQRVYRLVDSSGVGSGLRLIAGGYPAPGVHRGGAIAFGPDGLLYFTVGDVRDLDSPQDSTRPAGKIFRIRRDGTIPGDNPWPGSPVFARGVRNPQGLAWHPETAELFATEHGPTDFPDEGGREDQDELNLIVPGGNYGWPLVSGLDSDSRFRSPLAEWTPAIAPAGLAFYTGPYGPWRHNIFVGGMRGKQLRRIVLARAPEATAGWRVVSEQPVFQGELGRIRAVAMGRDGFLYFATSNRDGEGDPALGFDRVFRVRVPTR